MFPYMQICVLSNLLVSAFSIYVQYRQHKRYHPLHSPSARVASIIPHQKFVQAQTYCRSKSSFSIIKDIIESLFEAALSLTYVIPAIWTFAAKYTHSELSQTLLFSAFSALLALCLEIPSKIYFTFFLEAKFGFNRTTVSTFIVDIIKELALSAAFGLPIISILFYVLRYFSSYNPITIALGLWLLTTILMLTVMVIYPSVIAPLFNTFKPLDDGPLKEKLVALASRLHFPLDKMYVIDGSRRSSHSNAYIFGLFKKYICIYDSLLEQNKGHDDQVVSILCHELGHWKLSHLPKSVSIALFQVFVTSLLYGLTAGNPDLFKSFGYNDGMPLIIGLILFHNLLEPINDLLSPFENMVSRRFEYQADAFAKGQGMGEELGEALVAISISNLSNMSPDPLYSAWNYSHPTLFERLDALQATPKSKEE